MFYNRRNQWDSQEDTLQEQEEIPVSGRKKVPNCPVYNTDTCDEDLERYSQAVYEGKRRHPLLTVFLKLIFAAVLLGLCVWLLLILRSGGFL